MYVYVITNSVNGKVYVGKSVMPATRWARHKYDSRTVDSPLYRAMRKYGVDAFEFAVVEQCESEAASFVAEQQWVAKLGSIVTNGNGYNQNAGGVGAPRPTDECREKCGRGRRGRPQSPEHVEARVAAQRGKKRTPEAVANMRALRKPVSEETRAKQSAAKAGRAMNPEHVALRAQSTRTNGKKAAKMAKIREAHARGLHSKLIAEHVGCTQTLVVRYLDEMQLTPHPRLSLVRK
jgi:group I intron endonuclease